MCTHHFFKNCSNSKFLCNIYEITLKIGPRWTHFVPDVQNFATFGSWKCRLSKSTAKCMLIENLIGTISIYYDSSHMDKNNNVDAFCIIIKFIKWILFNVKSLFASINTTFYVLVQLNETSINCIVNDSLYNNMQSCYKTIYHCILIWILSTLLKKSIIVFKFDIV